MADTNDILRHEIAELKTFLIGRQSQIVEVHGRLLDVLSDVFMETVPEGSGRIAEVIDLPPKNKTAKTDKPKKASGKYPDFWLRPDLIRSFDKDTRKGKRYQAFGENLTVGQWAAISGINDSALEARFRSKIGCEAALSKPPKNYTSRKKEEPAEQPWEDIILAGKFNRDPDTDHRWATRANGATYCVACGTGTNAPLAGERCPDAARFTHAQQTRKQS